MAGAIEKVLYVFGRSLRETGLALDRLGCTLQGSYAFREELSRHRRVMPLYHQRPRIGQEVFIAPNASVIGSVKIGSNSSIWYGATLRGDVNDITVGNNCSIGDNAVVHVSGDNQRTGPSPTIIGDFVTVGNGAIIHGCKLESNSSVEMGSIVFDRVVVESHSVVGAGSVVTEGTRVPSGELWAGAPAKFVRQLTEEEKSSIAESAKRFQELGQKHLHEHMKTSHERYLEQLDEEFGAPPAPIDPHAPGPNDPPGRVVRTNE